MVTIVSVAHKPLNLYNGPGYGQVVLPGRGDVGAEVGRYVTTTLAEQIIEPEDVGGQRHIDHVRDGRTAAIALASPHLERGVFVAKGDVPTEQELEAAEARYTEYLRLAIENGLKAWEKRHLPQDVDEHAKIGAYVFRMNVPWGAPPRTQATIECEGCGEQISPKLAWHGACGAIFDRERAAALGYGPALKWKADMETTLPLEPEKPAGGKQARL